MNTEVICACVVTGRRRCVHSIYVERHRKLHGKPSCAVIHIPMLVVVLLATVFTHSCVKLVRTNLERLRTRSLKAWASWLDKETIDLLKKRSKESECAGCSNEKRDRNTFVTCAWFPRPQIGLLCLFFANSDVRRRGIDPSMARE